MCKWNQRLKNYFIQNLFKSKGLLIVPKIPKIKNNWISGKSDVNEYKK